MGISSYFEVVAGTLLKGVHGHDSNLVCKSPAFLHVGDPVLEVHAPECGPSGSPLQLHHSQLAGDGTQGAFPHLQWSRPVGSPAKVVEFVIVVEDPDVPIPTACPHHALLYGIPGDVTEATHMEIEMAHPKGSPEAAKRKTRAGWKYVPNIYGTSYIVSRWRAKIRHGRMVFSLTLLARVPGRPWDTFRTVTSSRSRRSRSRWASTRSAAAR